MKERTAINFFSNQKRKSYSTIYYFECKSQKEAFCKETSDTIDAGIPLDGLCPYCHSRVLIDMTVINSDDGKFFYYLHGLSCKQCRILFVRDKVLDKLYKVCRKNFPKGIRNYRSVGKREYQSFSKPVESFTHDKNIVCIIQTNKGERYTILNKNDDSLDDTFLYYKSEFARELLASAIRPEKDKNFKYGDRTGKIKFAEFFGSDSKLFAKDICIKKGGGYTSGKTRGGDHFVDVLFYSPFTKRYESVTVTYNIFDDKYYLDITKWRKFVREFGNPSIKPVFSSTRNYNLSDELRESSILRDYGYSSTLSTPARRSILTEMVDLDIVSVRKIIDYLKFFLDFHGAKDNMYNSCKAWSDDWDFIENYKVNPERFLIAKSTLTV